MPEELKYEYKPDNTKFNAKMFCECALQLVEHDEVERALLLLENIPGYYRDFVPEEIKRLKNFIRCKILTVWDIQDNKWDHIKDYEEQTLINSFNGSTRGIWLKDLVQKFNAKEVIPHIFDIGPGPYAHALGLKKEKLKFSYECYNLNKKAHEEAKEILGDDICRPQTADQPVIFVACEIIEHLFNENDIRYVFDKISANKMPEIIIMSTPQYAFGVGVSNWLKEGLSHLRTYTPNEFVLKVSSMFPEYSFSAGIEAIINIIGIRKEIKSVDASDQKKN